MREGRCKMKPAVWLIVFVVLACYPAHSQSYKSCTHHHCFDDLDFDIDDGSLIITSDDEDSERVEITEDCVLFVNGRRVETNGSQEELLEKYYDQFMGIIECAKEIGVEGAGIGARGAKVGLKAVVGLIKLLHPDYDSDDYDRDIEREVHKIEARAERLERKAKRIEDMVDDFERVHRRLRRKIPELRELDWF
jgi:hypothetical protein